MKRVYLDYAAATPLNPDVLTAMMPYLKNKFANPSSLHREGREQLAALEAARADIAGLIGAKPAEIIFTSGSTESAAIAVQGSLSSKAGSSAVSSPLEHEAVKKNLRSMEEHGHATNLVQPSSAGVIDVEEIESKIDDSTIIVCLQYVNNEIGSIQQVSSAGKALDFIRKERAVRGVDMPIYLYCDAAQAGLQNLQVSRLQVDLLSLGASKLYGPPGIGMLYIRSGTRLATVAHGGGQEGGIRSGTPNIAGAIGLARALELVQKNRHEEQRRQENLRNHIWQEVSRNIDNLYLNGDIRNRASGNLNFVVGGADGETLVAYLDKEGYATATGSACAASSDDPSHVLLAIGRSRAEAGSSLRITIGQDTSKEDADDFIKALSRVVTRVRDLS